MFISTKTMFRVAIKEKFAVPAFNVNNMEIIQAIISGANTEKSPVILQVSAGARKYANPYFLKNLVEAAIQTYPDIPVALHLDHGSDLNLVKDCVDKGFTSIMIDASKFELDKNINTTKEVVDFCHSKEIPVEAELGKLAGIEDDVSVDTRDAKFTDPKEAKKFVEETNCDSLAIAIGTSHGAYKFAGEPYLSFNRLAEIEKEIPNFPLVLHGASSVPQNWVKKCNDFGGDLPGARGVPENMLEKAAKNFNICKINIDTDLRIVFTASVREFLKNNPGEFDPRKYLGMARKNLENIVKQKIRMCNSNNKIRFFS